jgi:subtilisin family serine protease
MLTALLFALAQPERVSVIIELQSPPAIESYLNAAAAGKSGPSALRAAVTAARNEIAVVEAEQQSVAAQVDAIPSAVVLYRLQRLVNAIAVDVDASQLDAIRALPGVKSVEPLPIYKLTNTSSVPLIGAPEVWRALAPNGATGKNIKVGVVDTGLDYIHRDFGGNGDYAGKTFTGSSFPTTDKVAGGTDFAGDDYDASSSVAANRTPKPDGDPMDCAGHGSHVAGTIGGFGVKKDFTTYSGPFNVALDPALFSIGPGVAPEAKLFPIRIFGCTGTTGLVPQALEWALDPNKDGDFSDHMDVVNMSLGGSFGTKSNTSITAADNLAKAGCIVVASAGNEGDTYYITGQPATGDHVLSVASSVDALEPADGLQITAPASIAKAYTAHHSVNFDWFNKPAVSGTVARPVTQLSGCSAFPISDKNIITGKVALLDWTDNDCGSAVRVGNAFSAGAIGVILRHTQNELDIAIAGATTIPSTLVPRDTGDLILANLGGPAGGVVAAFNGDEIGSQAILTPANVDLLSSFTSRGPRIDDNGLKPEITAPGQSIWSVRAKSGFRGTSMSGTSMAAPHVAGAMALLKQLHPTWSPDELKALAMSTASHDLFTGASHSGSRYAVSRIGAGRIDVASAARTREAFLSTAQSNLGIIGASFGAPDVPGTFSATKAVVVLNKGSGTITTYRVAYDPAVTQPGVTFSVPDSVTVPANGSATFTLQMDANAAAMRHHRDDSLTVTQTSVTRSWLSEASGWVTLTAPGQETLRLPVFAAPRPASAMSATSTTFPDANGKFQLALKGTTLSTGNGTDDENALVAAFELSSIGTANASLRSNQNIKFTGIASDASTIYFAVATFGPWTSPVQTPIHIDIDTGAAQFRVTTTDLAQFTNVNNSPSDVYIASVCTAAGTNCRSSFRNVLNPAVADTVVFNTNVVVLPVQKADIGLSAAQTAFTYRVRIGTGSTPIDQTALLSYNTAKPGMSFTSDRNAAFGFADTPSNTLAVVYDKAAFTAAGSKGILLLHLHNENGKHEEIVTPGAVPPPRRRTARH